MKVFTRILPSFFHQTRSTDISLISKKQAITLKHLFATGFLLMVTLFVLVQKSSGQVIVKFDVSVAPGGTNNFGVSPFPATTSDPGVTIVGLTRGSGVGTTGSGAAKAWGGNNFISTSQATAISGNTFATFSITPNAGNTLSLSGIPIYNIRRSGTGPTTGIWQYKVGAGSFVDIGSAITWGAGTTATGNDEPAIVLSGISALQGVPAGTTVTFRILSWGGAAAGTWYINDQTSGTRDLIVNGTVTAGLLNQTISGFPTTDTKTYGIAPYNITGVTGGGSGNPVTFASDNPAIASVSGNTVTINSVGAGSVHITASQAGNGSYNAAPDVVQTLTVNKATQTITFGALINRNDVDPNFQLTATGGGSTSPIVYTSSLTSVAQIVNSSVSTTPDPNGNWVDIVGPGQTTITASQAGDANYLAATPVPQVQTIINTTLTPQTITFTALPAGKIYGDADFQITSASASSGLQVSFASSDPSVVTIVGINGDMIHIVGPGTATITASQAGNGTYSAAPNQQQNITIGKKTLTVSNATVDTKVYDGGVVANISNATLNGVISPDIVNIATTAGSFADPNVNNGIAVTANLTLGGADAVKYLISQPTGLTGDITKASQTITFNGPLPNKSPGDPNFNYTATTTSGLPITYTSGTPSVITVVSGSLVHVGAIGASTITASQAGNTNYFAATSVQQTQNVVASTPGSIFANLITDANPSTANPFTTGQTFNPNITVTGIGRGPGIVGTAAANRYNANAWNVAAFDATKYFEFKLTPNPGFTINFSSFAYNSQVSTTTINGFSVRSSVDNFATSIGTPVSGTAATLSTISLSAAAYQGITSAITFRVYAWGATASTTTFSINDFVFNGNVIVAPPTATFTKTDVSICGVTNDGSITVTPSGTGPFTYSWTGVTGSGNPATTPFPDPGNVSSLTGLPIGYYNVTITDANLNTATITGIHIGNAFSVFITNSGSISSACGNTGSIILYGNAGVQPYTYSLDNITYSNNNTFTNLAAGPYTAYIKDAKGCVNSKPITVAAAPALVSSPFVKNASSCGNDGSIQIFRSGGVGPYQYSLTSATGPWVSTNTFSNLAPGPYTAYVKDAYGCVASQAATITAGVGLTLTANKTNTSTCVNDGTIQLNASGGVPPYTYSIDGGSNYQNGNSFANLSANSYPAIVKDSKGCTGSLNVTINLNTINVTAYAVPATDCASSNGSIQLFRTGGVGPYTYSLDGNTYQASGIFTNLPPDFYIGYVKDSKTCIGQLIDILVGPESCLERTTSKTGRTSVVYPPANSELKVQAYPNPTASEFTLQLDGYSSDKVSIIVTDIMGRKVYQTEGTGKQQYRFGNKFNAGLYNVQVVQGNIKKSIKLVKE